MTQCNIVKIASLNVNELNNPVKRAKVLAKMKKEKNQVIYLQEMHLSKQEHDNLKKFGYKNTFFSAFEKGCKRGVAILISNSLHFQVTKVLKDKEGRYIIVKGKIENNVVTLINVYVPPGTDKSFLQQLFETIALESEETLLCWGL